MQKCCGQCNKKRHSHDNFNPNSTLTLFVILLVQAQPRRHFIICGDKMACCLQQYIENVKVHADQLGHVLLRKYYVCEILRVAQFC